MTLMAFIDSVWYPSAAHGRGRAGGRALSVLLRPLSWLFRRIVIGRRHRYLRDVAAGNVWRPPVPVIIVGNISVGGTGKTPVVIALLEELSALGYRPGVVTRGYGGKPGKLPLLVECATSAAECGDEPLLIRVRTGCPVAVDPDRPNAVRHLLAETDVDIVVSDDGLQHYQLYRDYELAVVDGRRGLGNGWCLPAGPLREPPGRLAEVDSVLLNGGTSLPEAPSASAFNLRPDVFVRVAGGGRRSLASFVDEFGRCGVVHAIAGIGNPTRFFASLSALGLSVVGHAFPDHHHYRVADIDVTDGGPIIMTEKDAVKCRAFADERHWYLAVDAQLPASFLEHLREALA